MNEFNKGDRIAEDFEIVQLISQGSFGKVYLGKQISKNIDVAIKVEKSEVAYLNSLKKEVSLLNQLDGVEQIPKVIYFGQEKGMYIMILNMLGKDLIYYLNKLKHFSYECVSNIMIQMIDILEQIHRKYRQKMYNRNIIHRDLKPENILGSSRSNLIYLIDFGIAKDLEIKKKSKEKSSFVGTTRYASLSAHLGLEQNKKDDLESLGYIAVYLLTKTLPWMNIDKEDIARIEKIGIMKQEIILEELCSGVPKSLLKYMKYIKQLGNKYKPNYQSLKSLFINQNPAKMQIVFDWNVQEHQLLKNKSLRSLNNIQNNKPIIKRNKNISQSKSNIQKIDINQNSLKKNYRTLGHGDSSDEQQQQSSGFQQLLSVQKSIFVDYSLSGEQSKISKFSQYRQKSSKSIFGQKHQKLQLNNDAESLIIVIQDECLNQQNESDLDKKYNQLHHTSVFYNFKNPIQDFKVMNSDLS